jgi:hypothetical protein
MREMPSEARPFVHLQQQFGDLDVRQDHCRLVDQRLGGVGTAASSGVIFKLTR